jgi:hypothetical protein
MVVVILTFGKFVFGNLRVVDKTKSRNCIKINESETDLKTVQHGLVCIFDAVASSRVVFLASFQFTYVILLRDN